MPNACHHLAAELEGTEMESLVAAQVHGNVSLHQTGHSEARKHPPTSQSNYSRQAHNGVIINCAIVMGKEISKINDLPNLLQTLELVFKLTTECTN